ncbi:EAL domain-containing protein [Roseibium denhamense]|uniref:Response regulator receiver modulated diguanylate cyclase/phosphodiesterase n=1 Tax=Roseibium denhamense TaxID=76305 RepID=A0ABY1PEB1_9HYPH|nr:EAL domain-containing protein [Roseibium denhamense]MTI06214.1 EAL domain-containing protein [Roseibium denhamense]SMP32568.1 response regulator receiver modulated diguanylate cyclase/phosphodiesterase [Roseibium denhamense]
MVMDFLAPSEPKKLTALQNPWKILIVDDDPDVHEVTKIAVAGCSFEDRGFELLHALSAEEAKAILLSNNDIAVALVDVVMESDTAGLNLVSWIRSELDNRFTRIILRTGQPGYAPQTDVIMHYDIDGYAEKAELSRTKLITAIVAALRGFKLVMSLETNRRKLKELNTHFTAIVQKNALSEFSSSVLEHLTNLIGRPVDGLLIGLDSSPENHAADPKSARVLAANGSFEDKVDLPVDLLGDDAIRRAVGTCVASRDTIKIDDGVVLPLNTRNSISGALYVGIPQSVLEDLVGTEVIQLFVSNIALGYEKTGLLEHIRNLAYVDRVTGLSTFSGFIETFERHISQNMPLIVVHADIQRFRVIVDGIGDEQASAVLKKTGHRLSQTFPDALTIARKERDEFLILLKGGGDNQVSDIVERVERAFQEPIALDDNLLTLRTRLGFSSTETGEKSAEKLVRFASIALNDVRQSGSINYAVFSPHMQEAAFERLRLASLLSEGADKTEFSAHYQPIMNASDQSIASFEALMRFKTPSGQFLNTASMIEAAEASGLITEIGAWMFKTSFAEFMRMDGLSNDVRLNVNLSPRQVQAHRIYNDIEQAATEANLPLSRLVFEVTEGLFLSNDQVTLSLLTWLRSEGAKIVIDDFGTGYSSFSYLRKLPVDGIKIDRGFIMNMDQDPDALAVVKSIIAVAQALDLRITAEGVETVAQRKIMQDLRCDYLQGYLYAKPLSYGDLQGFIQRAVEPGVAFG